MNEGDYTYVLECAETGEKHYLACKDGIYTVDGLEQKEPITQA